MKVLIAIFALILTVSSSHALDVAFTFTGTALDPDLDDLDFVEAGLGYNVGDVVTVQLVMDGSVLGAAGGGGIIWEQYEPSDPVLWKTVSGTGLTGSYVDPADPDSYVATTDSGFFGFQASSGDIDEDIGLVAPDLSLLWCVCADLNIEDIFVDPMGDQSAEQYFANYVGSVTVDPGMELMMEGVGVGGGMAHFETTSFTISIVPEPTTGVLMGLGLAGALLRRRR